MQAWNLSRCLRAGLLTGWARSLSLFVVSIILAYLNYRGLTIVGRVAIGMTLFIILTFVVLVGASIPHLQPANWLVVDLPSVDWRGFINVMFWWVFSVMFCCAAIDGVHPGTVYTPGRTNSNATLTMLCHESCSPAPSQLSLSEQCC